MRKLLLTFCLGLGACADKLTGPAAQAAAEAYRNETFDPRTRVFVNGVERDSVFLRSIDTKLIDSILIVTTKRDVADGVSSSSSIIRILTRQPR